jgi:hypothetical protein
LNPRNKQIRDEGMERIILARHSKFCPNKNKYDDDVEKPYSSERFDKFIFYHDSTFYVLETCKCLYYENRDYIIRDVIRKCIQGKSRITKNVYYPKTWYPVSENLKSLRKDAKLKYERIIEVNFIYDSPYASNARVEGLITEIGIEDYMNHDHSIMMTSYSKMKQHLIDEGDNRYNSNSLQRLDELYYYNSYPYREFENDLVIKTIDELIKIINKKIKDKQHDRK